MGVEITDAMAEAARLEYKGHKAVWDGYAIGTIDEWKRALTAALKVAPASVGVTSSDERAPGDPDYVCEPCVEDLGGTCHTPGCSRWMLKADDACPALSSDEPEGDERLKAHVQMAIYNAIPQSTCSPDEAGRIATNATRSVLSVIETFPVPVGDAEPDGEREPLPADLTLTDEDNDAVKFRRTRTLGVVVVSLLHEGRPDAGRVELCPRHLRELHEWLTRLLNAHDRLPVSSQDAGEPDVWPSADQVDEAREWLRVNSHESLMTGPAMGEFLRAAMRARNGSSLVDLVLPAEGEQHDALIRSALRAGGFNETPHNWDLAEQFFGAFREAAAGKAGSDDA